MSQLNSSSPLCPMKNGGFLFEHGLELFGSSRVFFICLFGCFFSPFFSVKAA